MSQLFLCACNVYQALSPLEGPGYKASHGTVERLHYIRIDCKIFCRSLENHLSLLRVVLAQNILTGVQQTSALDQNHCMHNRRTHTHTHTHTQNNYHTPINFNYQLLTEYNANNYMYLLPVPPASKLVHTPCKQ